MMGLGDELMASGLARVLHEQTGKKVHIVDRRGRLRHHEIWQGLPFLADRAGGDVARLVNGMGCRPYIASVGEGAINFKMSHRAVAGSVVIPPEYERHTEDLGCPFVLLEPNFKGTQSADNKDWGWDKWIELSDRLPGRLIQVPMRGQAVLSRAVAIQGQSLHQFAAWVKCARLVVTTDGGVHHMAAAVGTPAVVIWGGYTSPEILGYPNHFNIFDDHDESPCGRSSSCRHCRERMDAITVNRVEAAILSALSKESEPCQNLKS